MAANFSQGDAVLQYLAGELTFDEFNDFIEHTVGESFEEQFVDDQQGTSADAETIKAEDAKKENSQSASTEKKVKRKYRRTKIPKHAEGLMGEANIRFARGETDDAIQLCLELIKLAPNAPEVHETLGMIYEDQGQNDKAFQLRLLAAHLSGGDTHQWISLSNTAKEFGQIDTAIKCLNHALRMSPTDTTILKARAGLYESINDQKKMVETLQLMLPLTTDGPQHLALARQVVWELHEMEDVDQAINVMNTAFCMYPEALDLQVVNIFLELLLEKRKWHQAVWVLMCFCDVKVELERGNVIEGNPDKFSEEIPTLKNPVNCIIPPGVPVDLYSKLLVCFVHCGYDYCIEQMMSVLMGEDPEEIGDLFLDVAEALSEKSHHVLAQQLLQTLVHTNNYNLAGVWLKLAECLQSRGELTEAAMAYTNVVTLAPSHVSARVALSILHQQLGHPELALGVLSQAPDELGPVEPIDLDLGLPRCFLLYTHQWWKPFIKASKALLFGQFPSVLQEISIKGLLKLRTNKGRMLQLRAALGSELEQNIRDARLFFNQQSTIIHDNLWDLFKKLCEAHLHESMYTEMRRVTIAASVHPAFTSDASHQMYMDLLTIQACLLGNMGNSIFDVVREVCLKYLDSNQAWNMFAQAMNILTTNRHNRFCLRLLLKYPDHPALPILNGHSALLSGSYKYALAEYYTAFRADPTDPFRSFCIALALLHLTCQKFVVNRHALSTQSTAFLSQYKDGRGDCQEAYYNIGRSMQQLGLFHAAIHYYYKALSLPPVLYTRDGMYDLTRESAFNLALIYRNSGAEDMAVLITQKYLVI